MEIQAGEYIRSEYGEIAKVLGDDGNKITTEKYEIYFKNEIVKHSFNIIDLIEEGDIIKYRLNNLSKVEISKVKIGKEARTFKEYLSINGFSLKQIEIISIVTKEQFESMEYEV